MRSTMPRSAASLLKRASVGCNRPPDSTKIRSGPFTMISRTSSSASNASSGPSPSASSSTKRCSCVASIPARPPSSIAVGHSSSVASARSAASSIAATSRLRRSSCRSSCRCTRCATSMNAPGSGPATRGSERGCQSAAGNGSPCDGVIRCTVNSMSPTRSTSSPPSPTATTTRSPLTRVPVEPPRSARRYEPSAAISMRRWRAATPAPRSRIAQSGDCPAKWTPTGSSSRRGAGVTAAPLRRCRWARFRAPGSAAVARASRPPRLRHQARRRSPQTWAARSAA